ncbi:MAG TPA: DUF4129 domain-containing protein [Streptosporangiaceae bacterium]
MLTAAGAPAAVAAGRPGVGRLQGQQLARAELAKLKYHQQEPITQRVIDAVLRFLNRLGSATPGGWWTLAALGTVLVLAAAGVVAYLGPVRGAGRAGRGPLVTGTPLTARDYREQAGRLAAGGQFAAAIIECMRAIAAELDERGLLTRLPGRTAAELAAEAGRLLPGLARELTEAARLFGDVRYGGRPGTEAGYQRLRELDASVRASAPRVTGRPAELTGTQLTGTQLTGTAVGGPDGAP